MAATGTLQTDNRKVQVATGTRLLGLPQLPEMANGVAGQGSSGQRHDRGADNLCEGSDVHVPRQQEACGDRRHAHGQIADDEHDGAAPSITISRGVRRFSSSTEMPALAARTNNANPPSIGEAECSMSRKERGSIRSNAFAPRFCRFLDIFIITTRTSTATAAIAFVRNRSSDREACRALRGRAARRSPVSSDYDVIPTAGCCISEFLCARLLRCLIGLAAPGLPALLRVRLLGGARRGSGRPSAGRSDRRARGAGPSYGCERSQRGE